MDLLLYQDLNQPTNIAFCPDGRIFIPLKAGQVLTVEPNGTLNPNFWVDFSPDVHNADDRGDKNYVKNCS
jgi:hypothetical protein